MKKVTLMAFWISFGLGIISFLDRIKIWEVIKMLDVRIILEIGIGAIFLISGIICLREFRRDYIKTRKLVYQLFLESEGKRIVKGQGPEIRKAIRNTFEEARNVK